MYNKINHSIRNHAKLSMLDYCILDCIYQLSTSGKERYKGWCDMKKSNFDFLTSERSIVNAFNRLVKNGWMEFKNDKRRFLKRTTDKYYNEVRIYIEGVKELHPKGERVAPQGVKELHPKGERVAPNNNKNTNKDININKGKGKGTPKEKFSDSLEEKNEVQKSQKSCAKKGAHIFPDNTPAKSFDSLSDFDQRINKQLPFDIISASETMNLIFPKKQAALEQYNKIYSEKATLEIIKQSWKTFIEKRFSNSYAQVRTVYLLKKAFFEWTRNQVKYQRIDKNKNPNEKTTSKTLTTTTSLLQNTHDRLRRKRNKQE